MTSACELTMTTKKEVGHRSLTCQHELRLQFADTTFKSELNILIKVLPVFDSQSSPTV